MNLPKCYTDKYPGAAKKINCFRYIRVDDGKPVGVAVLTNDGCVGWSLCNPYDSWDKIRGLQIAFGRSTGSKKLTLMEALFEIDKILGRLSTRKGAAKYVSLRGAIIKCGEVSKAVGNDAAAFDYLEAKSRDGMTDVKKNT